MLSTAYWFLSVVLLHFLRSDYDPLENTISDYATGSYGYLMSAAFIIWGFGIVALASGLWLSVAPRPRVGSALVLIAGFAIMIAGVFTGDALTATTTTTSGAIHDLSSVIFFLTLIAAMFVMAKRFQGDEKWRQIRRATFWLGAASTVFLIAFILGPVVNGLIQRIFIPWLLAWVLLVGSRLWLVGRDSTGPHPAAN